MPKVNLNALAPDFSLTNITGRNHALSNFKNEKNVLLVFNRGFV